MSTSQVTREMSDLDRRRRGAGISVADICAGVGVSRATWYRWLGGKARPILENFVLLERVLFEVEQEPGRIARYREEQEALATLREVQRAKDRARAREAHWASLPPKEANKARAAWARRKSNQVRSLNRKGMENAALRREELIEERRAHRQAREVGHT